MHGPRQQLTGWTSRSALDATSLLTVFLVVRLAIPSELVVPGLRSAGSPALILSLGLLLMWVLGRLLRDREEASSPVLAAGWIFAGAYLLSLIPALLRPISTEELNAAAFGLVSIAGWLGTLSLAHDGPRDESRLAQLADRLVVIVAVIAALGLIQFVTGQTWVDRISIPGLTANSAVSSGYERGDYTRPSGTAIHPIEFGSVLSMIVPLAVVRGMGRLPVPGHAARGPLLRWAPAVLMSIAILLSSSRSAWVGLVIGVLVLVPVMNRAQRIGVVSGLFAGLVALFVLVPGMLGMIAGMFGNASDDSSIQSRLNAYVIAESFIARSPWWGRGLFTFLPRYQIFDNQYLLALVETGLIGLAALVGMVAVAALCGVAASRTKDPDMSALSLATTAGVVVGGAQLAFFDGFSFPMMAGIWFLLIGLVGACYRLVNRNILRPDVPLSAAL